MYYPQEVIDQVIAANDIVDVIGAYVKLKRTGSGYMGLCPFHSEKTPSFSVSATKQLYHCFGCGESGNVISFLMKYENYSFQEALQKLAERAGITLPEPNQSRRQQQQSEQRQRLLAINKEAATYYFHLLRSPKGANGYKYFAGRALTKETMNRFGLGYADGASNDLVRMLRAKGYKDEDILASGVAAFDEKRGLHDKFWNRVMYPIMDATGHVIGFGGRVMGDGKPKYLNSPETPVFDKSHNLYALNEARKTKCGYFILCEGYMDVIAQHQAGFTQAVASLGTSFTEGQASVIRRYVRHVLLAYDSDTAGIKAAMRNIGILNEAGIASRVIDLRPYKDPDEFIKAMGPEEYQKRLDNAENSFMYQLRQVQTHYDMSDPGARTEFCHEVAKRLAGIPDEIERENYIVAAGEKYAIPVNLLRRETDSYVNAGIRRDSGQQYVRIRKPSPGAQQADRKETPQQAARRRNERLLLTWISDDPEVYPQISGFLSADDFEEGIYRQTAERYLQLLKEHGSTVTPAAVTAGFDDPDQQAQSAALFETHLNGIVSAQDREHALRDVLWQVKKARIEEMNASGKIADLQKVVKARQELDRILNAHFHFSETSSD